MTSPFGHVIAMMHATDLAFLDLSYLVDQALREIVACGDLDQLVRELDDFVSTTADDADAARQLASATQDLDHPDGPEGAWRQLLVAVRERADEVRGDPHRLPPAPRAGDGLTAPRASAFTDRRLERRALDALRDLYADEIAEVRYKRAGWAVMTFHADLADSVGPTGEVVVGPRSAGGSLAAPEGTKVAVTGATASFWWDRFEREIRVSGAFPDVVLDARVRSEHPALCHFFGGAFGPVVASDGPFGPVPPKRGPDAAVGLMRGLKNPAYTQVRDELDRLLATRDDDRMRWVVEQCGSYALPTNVRYWVERLRWRFDAFDWQPDEKGRFG